MTALRARWLSRESVVTMVGLIALTALSWWYLFGLAADMSVGGTGGLMTFRHWAPSYFGMMLVMWMVMMIAMMTPSAVPMVLLYRQVARRNRLSHASLGAWLFTAGYLVIWAVFSLLATSLQWLLDEQALLSPMMRSQSALFSGMTLIGVGLYQFSHLKQACLRHCRGPLFFISQHWRPGLRGAFRMGIVHGGYCVGCCGALMALLFVGGVMDLAVIAAIALVVLLEKIMPGGQKLARGLGIAAMALGTGVIAAG